MNEKNITLMAMPSVNEEFTEIDLRDLLADFLLKWKRILALLLIGALLGFGAAKMKAAKQVTEPVTLEKAIENARARLSEDDTLMAEQLYFQYLGYRDYQKEMRSYYSNLAVGNKNIDKIVQMRAEYYIVSSIKVLDTLFIKMAVKEPDYQAMRDISPDEELGETIYDRVIFSTNKIISNPVITLPGQDDEESIYLIQVELYGTSEEQCREMMAVIEDAFRREAEELKVLDQNIHLESLGEQFNYNTAEHIQNLHKKNLDRMTAAEGELNNLKNKVSSLPANQKEYYDLLVHEHDQTYSPTVGKQISQRNWIVIGAAAGFVIAIASVFIWYLMNGKVQSPMELELYGRLLNRVFVKGKKNLFGRPAASLIHADNTDAAVKADIVATDLNIMMEKNAKTGLLLLCEKGNAVAADFAEQVKVCLQAKNGSLKVDIGNPLSSVAELEMIAQADMGVIFAETKKSERAVLREWKQFCERYQLLLAGTVAVRRCW